MNEFKRAILQHVWDTMYSRTCRCGRCDCASSDPVLIVRMVFWQESVALRHIAERNAGVAKVFADSAKKFETSKHKSSPEFIADAARARASEARFARLARRKAHAADLYERLSQGLPPFAATVRCSCGRLVHSSPCNECAATAAAEWRR